MAVVKTVGTGKDYTLLQTWESWADDQATADQWAECYSGSDLGKLTISAWTATPTVSLYPRVYVPKAERHEGKDNSTGAYVTSLSAFCIGCYVNYARIEGLRLETSSFDDYGIYVNNLSVGGVVLDSNLVLLGGTSLCCIYLKVNGAYTLDNCIVRNNICIYNGARSGWGIIIDYNRVPDGSTSGIKIHNNIIHRRSGSGDHGIRVNALSVDDTVIYEAKNNIVTGNWPNGDYAEDGGGTHTATFANNLSSDGTADDFGGSGALVNKTAANQFVDEDADWNLKAGADALDAGTTIPAFDWDALHDDADNWRPQGFSWDMGAIEKESFDFNLPTVYESPSVSEVVELNFDIWNMSVDESVLVTEAAFVTDLMIEIGMVADTVSVVEGLENYLDVLNVSVSEDVSVTESTVGFDDSRVDNFLTELTAYWPMEATGANDRLDMVGDNDLTPTNAPGTRAGVKANACDFVPASSQYLSIADNADISPSSSFAISVWGKFDSLASNQTILAKQDSFFLSYVLGGAEKLQVGIKQSDTTLKELKTQVDPSTTGFQHIVAMADGSNLRFYLNSTEIGTAVPYDGTILDNGNTLYCGAWTGSAQFLDGAIDEVAFFKDFSFASAQERQDFVGGLYATFYGDVSLVTLDVTIAVDVSDTVSITEDVELLDIVIEMPLVSDDVAVVEDLAVSLDALNLDVSDTVVVTEDVELLDLVLDVAVLFEELTVLEEVTVELDVLNVNEEDTLLVTESASVLDHVVEVGVVAETVGVTESATTSLDALYIEVSEELTITESVSADVLVDIDVFDIASVEENVQLLDIVVDLPVVFDTVGVLENVVLTVEGDVSVYDEATALENVALFLDVLYVDIFDAVGVVDVPGLNDLVVELGPAVDSVTVLEDVTPSLDVLNTLVTDLVTTVEDVTPFLDVLVPSAFDAVSLEENVTMEDLGLNFLAVDVVTISENVTQYLDTLNFLAIDPFHVLVTEVAYLIDLVIEVGVVMDPVTVTESATVNLDALHLAVYDEVAATEWVQLLDITVELAAVDLAAALESVELSITELYLVVDDDVTVVEYVELLDISIDLPLSSDEVVVLEDLSLKLDLLNVSVGEDLLVTEVVVTHDLVIELGVVADVVGAVENVALLPDALFLAVSDDVLAGEWTNAVLDVMNVAVAENVAHTENVELLDITIELPVVYETAVGVENVTLFLDELYLQAGDDVLVTEVAIMTDIVVELGPVVDLVGVTESVAAYLSDLNPSVSDTVAVDEWVQLLDLVIDLAVHDEITATESLFASLLLLNIVAGDDVLVTESVSLLDLVIEIGVVAEIIGVADVVEDVTTNSGEIPYCCQSAAWFDGTYYWRAWFNRTGGYIQCDYTTDPDGSWLENVGARISDANVLNDFSIYAKASALVIVYTQGGDVLIREATSYPTTSFTWSAATTIWTDVSNTYSRPSISRTQSNRYWASATEKDGVKQYAVVKRSGPGNITSWDSAATLGDTNNEGESFSALMHSLPLVPPTNFRVICVYVEGTQLQYKEFDGTWDASPTNIAVLKISPQSLVAHQFELNFDDVNDHVDMVYIKSDGTCVARQWDPVGGLGAEVVIDSNTDCEHPGIGTFGDYLVYAWDRPHGEDNNQFYVRLLHKTGHVLGPILAMTETTATMTRSDVSKTEDVSHSCFIYWEEASTVFTRTLEIGLSVNDTISVAEWVELLDLVVELEVSELVTVVEWVQLLDIVIEIPLVFDEVTTTEDVTAYLDELSLSLSDQVSIAEVAIMTDIVIELGPATEEVAITENVSASLDVLALGVIDALNIVEWVSLLDIVIDLPVVFDVVTATEQVTAYPDELFLSVVEDVTITEVALMTDLVIEVGPMVDLVAVTEQADVVIGFLNISESETLAVAEWANLLDITVELFAFDTVAVTESVNMHDIVVEMFVSDIIGALEAVTVSLDALFVAAGDDIVAVEAVVLQDIIVELSASDDVSVVENTNVVLGEIFISVADTVAVSEWAYLLDIVIELPVLSEDITVVEDVEILLPELNTDLSEIIAVTDVAVMNDLVIELGIVTEVVTVSEYAELLDLTIEMFALDALEVLENVGLLLGELFLQAGEDITATEDVEVVDITIELGPVYDDVSVSDVVVDLRPDVLNFFVVQPMMIVVTEVAQIIDIVIELGIVAEYNFVNEFAAAYPDVLVPEIEDDIAVTESVEMLREHAIEVYEDVAAVESFVPDMPINFEAAEQGGVQIIRVTW